MPGIKRSLVATSVAVLSVWTLAGASAQGATLTPATEDLFISAGCPQSTPGTCTSTRWVGKKPGDATSNFVTSITPVDEVNYRAAGTLNWRDYASDESLSATGYPLQASEPIAAVVAISTNGAGANIMVHARVQAIMGDGKEVTFGPLEKTVTVMGPASTEDVPFSFDIPDQLEGKVLKSLTFYVALHGVNVAAGYINQQGGSTLKIPYYASA